MKHHVLVISEHRLREKNKGWGRNDIKAIEYKNEKEALTYLRALSKKLTEKDTPLKRYSVKYHAEVWDDYFEMINS